MAEQNLNETNQAVPENIVDLIKKCLALSESPNEFEAELAMSKAQELLLKYNLSMSQIKDVPTDDADLAELIDCRLDIESGSWLRILYSRISALNYCKVVGLSSEKKISVLGRHVNVLATIEMAQWLQSQIERLCFEACNTDFRPLNNYGRYESKRSFKKAFCFGIVARVYERLQELQNASIASNNTARGLIIRLDQETKEFVIKVFPNLTSSHYSLSSSSGYEVGKQYADRVSIIRPSQSISSGQLSLSSGGKYNA